MKLNKKLIKKLRNGELAVENNGTLEQLTEVLKAAFPKDKLPPGGISKYYKTHSDYINKWGSVDSTTLPIISVADFYKPDLFTGWAKDDDFLKWMFYFKDDVANFGFDTSGVWQGGGNYEDNYSEDEIIRPATNEEIEATLIKEAYRRGYKGGDTIKGIHGTHHWGYEISSFYYDQKYDKLHTNEGCVVYWAGQWAEIVEEPKPNPIHYVVDDMKYSLDYQGLKRQYKLVVEMSDEKFMAELPKIAHLGCIISYFKGLGNNATIGDKGIVHELIHLMTEPNEPTNDLQEIRESFNEKIKLS